MPDWKRYGVAGATMATILLTGQVMQMSSDSKSAKVAEIQAMPLPVQINDITLTAAGDDGAEPVVTAALDTQPEATQPSTLPTPSQTDACAISMTAEPKAAALVSVSINAPCQPNERVELHHNGMMFAEVTNAKGTLETTVPALAETAVFLAAFANGEGAVANTTVESLKFYDRAVVQMQGADGISLHAREYAAEYGANGHVWTETPGSVADAATGHGGFMIQLGDKSLENPVFAEVYTFPTALAKTAGEVVLSVDIEITDRNCSTDIEAQTLQTSAGERLTVQNLDMSMPDCDTVGDFLVLNNLVNDLKVASN